MKTRQVKVKINFDVEDIEPTPENIPKREGPMILETEGRPSDLVAHLPEMIIYLVMVAFRSAGFSDSDIAQHTPVAISAALSAMGDVKPDQISKSVESIFAPRKEEMN